MEFLKWTAYELSEAPRIYGFLHILFLVLMLGVLIFMLLKIKIVNEQKLDKVVLIFGILFSVIEVYKQLVYTFVKDGIGYQWYVFPFQFCSSPMYVCLLTPLISNKKIKEALYDYLAIFGTIGGLIVMIYPGDILIATLSISLHSLIWHSSMVILGLFILIKRNYGIKIKEIIPGLVVFYIFVLIAQILNVTFYHAFIKDIGHTFNMFFVSPYFECSLPVFNIFYHKLGWGICFILYLISFSLASVIIHYIVKGCRIIKKRIFS